MALFHLTDEFWCLVNRFGWRWTHTNRFLTHTDNYKLRSWAKGILDHLKLTRLLVFLHTDSLKWKNKTFKHLLSIAVKGKDNEEYLYINSLFKYLGNFCRLKNCICEKDIHFYSIFLYSEDWGRYNSSRDHK